MFTPTVKVADEVWIATALLHVAHPNRESFSVGEIVHRVSHEALYPWLRPGVQLHASVHCVANKKPSGGFYRMLYETARAQRRLVRQGDTADPSRHGKIAPNKYDIPQAYWRLLDWYHDVYDCEKTKPDEPDESASSSAMGGTFSLHTLCDLHTLRDLAEYLRQLDHNIEVKEPFSPRHEDGFSCSTCGGELYVSQPDPNVSIPEDFHNLVRIDARLLALCNGGEEWMFLRFPLNDLGA